jgi:Meiotically up-regulated gene 113
VSHGLLRAREVYFAATVGGPFVKIGCSFDARKRLRELRVATPWELELLAVARDGARLFRERSKFRVDEVYHEALRASRVRGEWFEYTAEVADAIARVRSGELLDTCGKWYRPASEAA